MQINKVEYPDMIDPSQAFEVKTHLTVSCSISIDDLSGRVDLVEQDTHKTVSISALHFSYTSEAGKPFNLTVVNEGQAPAAEKYWKLTVIAVVSAEGNTVASAEDSFSIQVGVGDGTQVWLGILVAVTVVVVTLASLLYFVRGKRQKARARN
jgi:hypothetical protein